MHVVTVMFANREQGVLLWFDTWEAAHAAYEAATETAPTRCRDDYGNVLWLGEAPAAVLMADHEKQLRAQAECALIGARVQADTNDQANADPILRAAGARARAAQARQFGGGLPLVNG